MFRMREFASLRRTVLVGALILPACGSDDAGTNDDQSPATGGQADAGGQPSGPQSSDAGASTTTPPPSVADASPSTVKSDAATPSTPADAGAPSVMPDAGKADGGSTTPPGPPGAMGPDDGDPMKPVVALPDIPCGGPKGGLGLGSANLKVDDRDVILTYPCDKREGANVTFLLLLHGTNANEQTKAYIHRYFAAHPLATTHNLIVATPKSRVSQWGNTTENAIASEDKPHLLHVIDYVYKTFGTKFNITSMWVGGHSWGAMYAKAFVCDETIKDKARGVIGMSGGSTSPGRSFIRAGDLMPTSNCTDYISQIHLVGDMDSVAGMPDQTAAATKHGCMAKKPAVDLGNMQMMEEWPGCSPGWVHENITMGAHTHTTSVNPEVVKHVVEKIKATEKR